MSDAFAFRKLLKLCRFKFFENKKSQKMIVFFPSMRSKNVRENPPHGGYFPRISWRGEFQKNYNVLYIADPFEDHPLYKEIGGSWFISPEGETMIPCLAECLKEVMQELNLNKIVMWGSSMGGYPYASR